MSKLERQMQLITLLLSTHTPLAFTSIQAKMPEFYGQSDVDAAKRMFERDKDDLRDMGVPIVLEQIDRLVDGDLGYRIPPESYYLPEIEFTAEEAAALTVLASDPGDDDAAIQGLRKLIYGVEEGSLASQTSVVAPGPDPVGGQLSTIMDAMGSGVAVSFAYTNASGAASVRTIDPFGLATRKAHWYVVGLDHDAGEIRAFRASRMGTDVTLTNDRASEPPDGFDPSAHIAGPWEQSDESVDGSASATVAVDPRVASWALRSIPRATRAGVRDDGWILLDVPPNSDLASTILRFGADAEAVAPEPLRDEIVGILTSVVARGTN